MKTYPRLHLNDRAARVLPGNSGKTPGKHFAVYLTGYCCGCHGATGAQNTPWRSTAVSPGETSGTTRPGLQLYLLWLSLKILKQWCRFGSQTSTALLFASQGWLNAIASRHVSCCWYSIVQIWGLEHFMASFHLYWSCWTSFPATVSPGQVPVVLSI